MKKLTRYASHQEESQGEGDGKREPHSNQPKPKRNLLGPARGNRLRPFRREEAARIQMRVIFEELMHRRNPRSQSPQTLITL